MVIFAVAALARLITSGALLDFSSERGKELIRAAIDRTDAILDDHNVGDLLPG